MIFIDHMSDDGDIDSQVRRAFDPLELRQVLLCEMLNRIYVLVEQSQLSLARSLVPRAEGRTSRQVVVLTDAELEDGIETAIGKFAELEGMTDEMAQSVIEQGYLTYRDLSGMQIRDFVEMFGVDEHHAAYVLEEAIRRADSEATGE